MDTSWKNNKKSLWGLGVGFLFLIISNVLGLGGIIGIILFFVGFYVGYKFLGNKDTKNVESPTENQAKLLH